MSSLRAALFATLFCMAVINSKAYPGQFAGQYPAQFGSSANEESVFRGQAEYAKRRPAALRNCFLSPVQCLLPVDNQRFNKFHKRFFFDS